MKPIIFRAIASFTLTGAWLLIYSMLVQMELLRLTFYALMMISIGVYLLLNYLIWTDESIDK
jgi:hypothetical protein